MKKAFPVRSLLYLLLIISFSFQFVLSQDIKPCTGDSFEILIGSFRGNNERNYYGDLPPSDLRLIWKFNLGTGKTVISRKIGTRIWSGAGWTGQPLFVREGNDTFLVIGSYDHHLRKINIRDSSEVWKYKFDDVVKGTGSLYVNPRPASREESLMVLQGSRLGIGNYLDSRYVPSYRAISYYTGKELWRLESKWTESYSRDVDGSALIFKDTAYIGLENGLFTVFDPDPFRAAIRDSMLQPLVIQQEKLYDSIDVISHRNNVVTESSPALLNDRIYIASGSGHVYGYHLLSKKLDWDFFTGSDMDGSVVVTSDSCILVSVEKQYIEGKGGVFKLDPRKDPSEAVIWYFEVQDTSLADWEGGVIGTVGINDRYVPPGSPRLAAIPALDGYLYIVDHGKINPDLHSTGPDGKNHYPAPVLIDKIRLGPSISSPVLTEDRLVFAGYNGIYLYNYSPGRGFEKQAHFPACCEASPVFLNRRLYIASRDGYLYCLGNPADE